MSGNGPPPAWLVRLAAECDEAKGRSQRLAMFIGQAEFAKLPWRQRAMLLKEAVILGEYIAILSERLQESMPS